MLHDFIASHRQELIDRTRAKVALRSGPQATFDALENGVPLFLTQLGHVLASESVHATPDGSVMGLEATAHGNELLEKGFSIAQVVHNYGDVCQAVTELAVERNIPISTEDFHTLNRCLDDAIASAVTEYARQSGVDSTTADLRRHGAFAHELRNHLNTATLAYHVVKTGRVATGGSTVEVLGRALRGLGEVIDRSLTVVVVAAGTQARVDIRLSDFVHEMALDARVNAADRNLQFDVSPVDPAWIVRVDRHLFASAISNLLQNAFKFTGPAGRVSLRTAASEGRVAIEIEDECGGLPIGAETAMFRPFEQLGSKRGGLGLGLTIAREAIEADGGRITLRDLPGQGCIFRVELPLAEVTQDA